MSIRTRLQLCLEGTPVRAGTLWASLLRASDRPDRLEVALAAPGDGGLGDGGLGDGGLGEGGAEAQAFCPGRYVSAYLDATLDGSPAFDGRIARVTWGIDRTWGRHVSIVAYSAYHFRRGHCARVRYDNVTDSEIAERIASELELVPRVDRTEALHAGLVCEEDSLVFLRRRARACGFHLAVGDGKLFFSRELPAMGEEIPIRFGPESLSLEVVDRGGATENQKRAGNRTRAGSRQPSGSRWRGGEIEVSGDVRCRPLAPLSLSGFGPSLDGRYRIERCLHRLDRRGHRTRVEFLEAGLDWDAWTRASVH